MGYGATVHLTAIGDTVNVASRLQDATKEYSCQLMISAEVAAQSGLVVDDLMRHEITVRNRREALAVFVVNDLLRSEERMKDAGERMKSISGSGRKTPSFIPPA